MLKKAKGKFKEIYFVCLYVLLFVITCCYQFIEYGRGFSRWDWTFPSGFLVSAIAIWFLIQIPSKMEQALKRLHQRKVFDVSETEYDEYVEAQRSRNRCCSKTLCILFGVGSLIALPLVYHALGWLDSEVIERIITIIILVIGGFIAGWYFGIICSVGMMGLFLKKKFKKKFKVQPGHIDGVAGMNPIGQLYLYQAKMISIPILFVSVWLVLFWRVPIFAETYDQYHNIYLPVLPIFIVIEILAFLLPLWVFHRLMLTQKREYFKKADNISYEIIEIKENLSVSKDPKLRESLQNELSHKEKRYRDIEAMPTWPVTTKTFNFFTLANLMLVLPFVLNIIGLTD